MALRKFNRAMSVEITGNGKTIIIPNYKMNFEVTTNMGERANTLALTITGYPPDKQQELLSLVYGGNDKENDVSQIVLRVGYAGSTNLGGTTVGDFDNRNEALPVLFIGTPKNIDCYKEVPEVITVIYAHSVIHKGYKKDVNLKPFPKGTTDKQILEALLSLVEVEVDKPYPIPNGSTSISSVSVEGSLEDRIIQYANACDTDIYFGIPLVVLPNAEKEQHRLSNVTQIASNTGLLGSPTLKNDGVDFEALIDAKIKPLSIVEVISDSVRLGISNPYYDNFTAKKRQNDSKLWVNKVNYIGSNYDNTWSMLVDARFFYSKDERI